MQINNTEQALEICNDVISRILPVVQRGNADDSNFNWLGLTYLVLPCVEVLRAQGVDGADRAWEVFDTHLDAPYSLHGVSSNTHAKYFILPLRILLQCGRRIGWYDGVDRDVDWVLDGGKKMPEAYEEFLLAGRLLFDIFYMNISL